MMAPVLAPANRFICFHIPDSSNTCGTDFNENTLFYILFQVFVFKVITVCMICMICIINLILHITEMLKLDLHRLKFCKMNPCAIYEWE